jgi:Mn-dependent DtxR family transcriptional regulator
MERQFEEQKILSMLKQRSLNTLEVASKLKVDRHTVIKYLESMESKGLVNKEIKRRAKLWHVSQSPITDVLKRKDMVSKQLADILNTIDHHISIQDKKLEIIWKNDYAKSKKNSPKCHEAYFDKNHRCKDCPVERTFHSGKPEKKEIKISGGLRTITTTPLKDEKNNTVAVVEIIKESENANKRK